MGNFSDWSAEGMTVEECDRIALENGGVIRSFGYGYDLPRDGEINAEYESVLVGACGMGNHGTLILRGRTRRARSLVRAGKIRRLVRKGVSEEIAEMAVSVRYGLEDAVLQLADALVEASPAGRFTGNSHREFRAWAGVEYDCSYFRAIAALEIYNRVMERRLQHRSV